MNSVSTSSPLFEQLDNKFRAFLRSHGLVGTRHREMILKVLLSNTAPVTARDIHYQVKTANSAVSFHCVYHTMTLLVRSGLVKEIIPEDGSARLYTHDIAIMQCRHPHCICQECGAVIEVMDAGQL